MKIKAFAVSLMTCALLASAAPAPAYAAEAGFKDWFFQKARQMKAAIFGDKARQQKEDREVVIDHSRPQKQAADANQGPHRAQPKPGGLGWIGGAPGEKVSRASAAQQAQSDAVRESMTGKEKVARDSKRADAAGAERLREKKSLQDDSLTAQKKVRAMAEAQKKALKQPMADPGAGLAASAGKKLAEVQKQRKAAAPAAAAPKAAAEAAARPKKAKASAE